MYVVMESANVYGFSRFKYSGNCWEGLKQMPSYGTYFLLKHRIWRPSKIGAGSKTCSIPLHESCTQTICFNTWCQGYKVSCSVNFRFPCKSFMKLCGKLLLELRTRLEKDRERERGRERAELHIISWRVRERAVWEAAKHDILLYLLGLFCI